MKILFDGTFKSIKPLFPIENAILPCDFDREKGTFTLHTRYGDDIAEIGDYIHKDDSDGHCWVSPMNRVTTQ